MSQHRRFGRTTRTRLPIARAQGLLFTDDLPTSTTTSATAAPPRAGRRHHLPPARLLGAHRSRRAVHPRGHAAPARSASTASATSSSSRSSSGCSTPASRCSTSASPSTHLRERGVDDLAQITLMSDGATVYECTSADEVIDLRRRAARASSASPSAGVWREVEGRWRQLPGERADGADAAVEPSRRRAVSAPPGQVAADPTRPPEPDRPRCATPTRRICAVSGRASPHRVRGRVDVADDPARESSDGS